MLHVIRAVGLLACILALCATAPDARAGPREDCESTQNVDLIIRGCTEVIRRDKTSKGAYSNRGLAYGRKGDYERAAADFTRIIEIDPKYLLGHHDRGWWRYLLRDYDGAIADYNEALRLDPNFALARSNRGSAYRDKGNYDQAIADYNEALRLNPSFTGIHLNRGIAYHRKGDFDRAIADYTETIKLNLSLADAYINRGLAHGSKDDYDRAIADFTKGIEVDPKRAQAYGNRGSAYSKKGDHDRAIADLTRMIEIDPRSARAYNVRGWSYYLKGDHQSAVADATTAISIDAKDPNIYHTRGDAYRALRQYDRAIGDFNQALALDASHLHSIASRGRTYEAKGDRERAIEDYGRALALPAKTKDDKDEQAEVEARLAALRRLPAAAAAASPAAPATPAVAAAPVPVGRRVALVIGNAGYRAVPPLANPLDDARRVAGALRAAGFSEVMDRYDLSFQQMRDVLAGFEDKVAGADWALVYYAGHGIEVDGRNFLIPIDAKLKRTTDVEDEALALDRVMARVAAAKRLQLVILDACRENPFRQSMAGTTRAIGERGLARIEPSHPNLMVAYAARDGQVALDGAAGAGSPYAKALVKHLAEPGLELSVFFRRVRAEVLTETDGKQRPFEYGSLTSEDLFFRPVAR